MTNLPRQWIGDCVSDSQVQIVLLDGGVRCQNAIPRDAAIMDAAKS